MGIYWNNNSAKFHPDPIWNDGALRFFENRRISRQQHFLWLHVNRVWRQVPPTYLCDELRRPADTEARRRLRSASSTSLDARRLVCPLSATERFLLQPLVCGTVFHRTSLLPPSLSIFYCRLKSHRFWLFYPTFWLFSHLYSAGAV